ncbi:MAG: Hsp20/alpha crystallin family protein [Desulfohalobiaceae bacterium]
MVLDFRTLYQDLPRNMEQFLDEMWHPLHLSQRKQAYPPVNIVENEEDVTIYAIVPGVDQRDIDLTFSENSLVIKGERQPEQGRYFRQERPSGPFQRIINFNIRVDQERTRARLKDGLLTIVLPKVEEAKRQQIEIEKE